MQTVQVHDSLTPAHPSTPAAHLPAAEAAGAAAVAAAAVVDTPAGVGIPAGAGTLAEEGTPAEAGIPAAAAAGTHSQEEAAGRTPVVVAVPWLCGVFFPFCMVVLFFSGWSRAKETVF